MTPAKAPESPETYEMKLLKMMQYVSKDIPMPIVTAEMWCVFDVATQQMMHGKLPNQKREVASLTKMMTFYTSYKLLKG